MLSKVDKKNVTLKLNIYFFETQASKLHIYASYKNKQSSNRVSYFQRISAEIILIQKIFERLILVH